MMKKLLSVLLVLLLVLSLWTVSVLADNDVTLSIETALDGDTIIYTISVNGRPAKHNIAAMQFDITPEAGVTLTGYDTFNCFTDAEAYNDSVGRFTGIDSQGIAEDTFTVMTLTGVILDDSDDIGITLSDVLIVDEEENNVSFTLDNHSTVQDTIEQTVGVTMTAEPQAVQAADGSNSKAVAEASASPINDSSTTANGNAVDPQPVDGAEPADADTAEGDVEVDAQASEDPATEEAAETSSAAANSNSNVGLIISITAIIIIALAVVIIVAVKAKKKKASED